MILSSVENTILFTLNYWTHIDYLEVFTQYIIFWTTNIAPVHTYAPYAATQQTRDFDPMLG